MLLHDVSHRRIVSSSTPQFCEDFAQVLNQSANTPHIDALDDKDAINTCLEYLAALAVYKSTPTGVLFENDEVKYELRRDDDNIYLTKTSYVMEFSWTTLFYERAFFDKRETARENLCTLPIQKILDVTLSLLEGREVQKTDHAVVSLVQKNNLQEFISSQNGSGLESQTVVKIGRLNTWRTISVSTKSKDQSPRFQYQYLGVKILSEDLLHFFEDGKLPDGNPEKALLLWECWQIIGSDNRMSDEEGYGYLQCILDRITHLEFTLEKIQFDPHVWNTFGSLLEFLAYRFKGSAISFDKLNAPNCKSAGPIVQLFGRNPNLTRLTMSDCVLQQSSINALFIFVGKSSTLTELHFDGCIQQEHNAGKLLDHLASNRSLKVLSIKNSRIDASFAKALLLHPAMTSLNFEGSTASWTDDEKDELLKLLDQSTMLTSFKMDWESEEKRKECEGYMNRNFFDQHGASYINFYEFLNADLPKRMEGELPDGVPRDVKNIIFSMLYLLNHNTDTAIHTATTPSPQLPVNAFPQDRLVVPCPGGSD